MDSILQIQQITKRYGGMIVNRDVTFEIPRGSVTGVIGPNGAGKTTLFNLVTGYVRPDSGTVFLDGKDITGLAPHRIVRAGISRTFQLVRVFPRLSLLDNVMMGYLDLPGNTLLSSIFTFRRKGKYEQYREHARALLDYVGLSKYEQGYANDLSYGQQKLVEIGRALASDPKILLLDEPLAGLNVTIIDKMLRLISDMKQSGKTVIIIEHNTEIMRQICDQITVLNFGEVIASGDAATVFADPVVIDSYLGTTNE